MNDTTAGDAVDAIDADAVRELVDYLADRIDLATLVQRLGRIARAHEAAGRARAAIQAASLYLAFVSQSAERSVVAVMRD